MDTAHLLFLALLQGLTEFLPISSSAHLILVPRLLGWSDQGLAFDVAVHVGTLVAVVLYFRTDLARMARAWLGSIITRTDSPESRLAWAVLWGTVPVGAVGLLLNETAETLLRSPLVIAVNTLGFALLLWWADHRWRGRRDEHQLTWLDVVLIGCAQALALVPGTSRSGVTMTAGLMLGLTRTAAARFSFLLSIPVILFAGLLKAGDVAAAEVGPAWGELALGAAAAAVSAFVCIHLFLGLIARIGMGPFVVYRVLLGLYLLYLFA